MKTKIKISVALFIMLVSCTNLIVKNVNTLKQSKPRNHLISYFLPKRVIEIKFTIEHQVTEPSVFLEESEALESFIKSVTGKEMVKKKTHKLVLKGVELNPISIADPKKLYSVDYRKSPFSKLEGVISTSETGLIQSGTSSTESKAYQILQTGFESIAGIVANIAGLKKGPFLSDIAKIKGDSKMINEAKELLQNLVEIQSSKASLIASVMNMDNKLFEAKLTILKELEDGLIQQLTGEITKMEYIVCKTWDPTTEDLVNGEIKKTYNIEMVIGKNGKVKLNIPVTFIATVDINIYNSISASNSQEYNDFVIKNNKKIGFYYNIPVPMTIKVYKDTLSDFTQLNFTVNSNKQSSITLQMPQFGTVDFLPAQLKKSDAKFYSDLGSIKEYSFTKEISINPDEVKNISSSIDTVFSTIKYFKNLKESVIVEKEVESDESELYNVNITILPKDK